MPTMGASEPQSWHEAADSPPPSAAPRRGMRLWVVIAVVVPVALLGMWYSDRIGGFFAVQRWSPAGPRATLEGFANALRAGDVAALEQLSASRVEYATDESGQFAVKLAYGPSKGPPKPAAALTPSVPVSSIPLQYDLANAEVKAEAPSESGMRVTYVLVRVGGVWKVKLAVTSGVPGA